MKKYEEIDIYNNPMHSEIFRVAHQVAKSMLADPLAKALNDLCESVLDRTGGPLPWPELEEAQRLLNIFHGNKK